MRNQLLTAVITLTPITAVADYQFEVVGALGQADTTTTLKTQSPVFVGGTVVFTDRLEQEADVYQLSGRLHFDSVKTGRGPLAEAAFLDQSSFVEFQYSTAEPDDSAYVSTDTYHIGGRFTKNALIVEAGYIDTHVGEQNDGEFRVAIGGYLNDRTDILLSYRSSTDSDDDLDVVDAALHGVMAAGSSAHLAYDLAVAYIGTGDDDGYGLSAGATVYFTPRFGFGIHAALNDVGEQQWERRAAHLSFFPSPKLLVTASLFDESMEFDDLVEVDSDGFKVGVSLRF